MSYDKQCSSCGGFCGRGGCKRENVKVNKQREALQLALEAINSLWNIIDDIDTASDIAKFDDRLYRNQVESLQARRWRLDISTDGQLLIGKVINKIREALAEPARKPLTDEEMRDAFLADPDPIFKLYKVSAGLSCAELDEILKRVARAIERAHGIGDD